MIGIQLDNIYAEKLLNKQFLVNFKPINLIKQMVSNRFNLKKKILADWFISRIVTDLWQKLEEMYKSVEKDILYNFVLFSRTEIGSFIFGDLAKNEMGSVFFLSHPVQFKQKPHSLLFFALIHFCLFLIHLNTKYLFHLQLFLYFTLSLNLLKHFKYDCLMPLCILLWHLHT